MCSLCGTLNHERNAECWTCRWHGQFSREERVIEMACQRLESVYGSVCMEHVTASQRLTLAKIKALRPARFWHALGQLCRAWRKPLQPCTKRSQS